MNTPVAELLRYMKEHELKTERIRLCAAELDHSATIHDVFKVRKPEIKKPYYRNNQRW